MSKGLPIVKRPQPTEVHLVPRLAAAQIFGCSPKTFDIKIRPFLSVKMVGRRVMFSSEEILKLLTVNLAILEESKR